MNDLDITSGRLVSTHYSFCISALNCQGLCRPLGGTEQIYNMPCNQLSKAEHTDQVHGITVLFRTTILLPLIQMHKLP